MRERAGGLRAGCEERVKRKADEKEGRRGESAGEQV